MDVRDLIQPPRGIAPVVNAFLLPGAFQTAVGHISTGRPACCKPGLAEYRRVRQIGAMYNNSGKSRMDVVAGFAAQSGYKDESGSADVLLTIA